MFKVHFYVRVTMSCLLAVVFTLSVLLQTAWGSALHARNRNVGIYGGHTVSILDNPYMAALYSYEEYYDLEFMCGGSIIHKRFILTAAHCFRTVAAESAKVLVGADNLDERDGVFFDVEKTICHEGFIQKNDDICLLKLKEPIVYGDKVKRVTLPEKDFELDSGVLVNITGWGATDDFYDTKVLQQTTIPIESQDSCRREYEELTDKMVCAGSRGHDACWGDSGSPLTHNGIQIGIVSYGHGCGRVSTVYTKVASYLNWINTQISENV